MSPHKTIMALLSRGRHSARLQQAIGLGTLILVLLVALLPQANVMGQFGFNVPYSDHDLSDPGTIDTFELHSNPGASKVIYMDFNGHIAPEWDDFVYAPYDFDGDPNSFSDTEKREIRLAWQSVAEDFLPFDVDVTTEDPGVEALQNTFADDGTDTEWGIRAVISDTEGSGGWAIIGSFDETYDRMLYAASSLTEWLEIADMVSHEVGHAVGLKHDGEDGPGCKPDDCDGDYWYGHGTPGTATYYAPIMGWSNYGPSQWSIGEYEDANNQEDDLEIITNDAVGNTNGFGYRSDDHGSNTGSATPITDGVLAEGIIERNDDLDYFSFTMSSPGTVMYDINPNAVGRDYSYGFPNDTGTVGANLDILAEIRDSGGNVIHTSNPIETLDASFLVNLSAGNYYLSIDGTGKGDPLTNGYSEYGSLGYFSVLGSGWDDPAILGDINDDDAMDGADWTQFVASLYADLSGFTPEEQFSMGDLNADGFNNYADLQLFTTYYEIEYGPGAFAAMVASIPEPTSILLLAIGSAGLGMWRRRKAVSSAIVTAMAILVLLGSQSVEAAIVNLPVSDPSFEVYSPTTPEAGGLYDYFTNISPDWKAHGSGNFLYDSDYGADTTTPTDGVQAAHGYGSGYQWQATTSIYGSDGVDSIFTFSALISGDDPNTDVTLYLYDAGIDGTLGFTPGTFLASASFNPPDDSWTREQVTYDATGSAAEGNRVGIAMYLDTEWKDSAAADAVELTGPIAIPPAPPSPLEIIIDRATGLITMDNLDIDAIDRDISYYEITSAAGALDPTEGTGWYSLSDQNIDPMGTDPGETWDEAGGSNANILSEVFLLGSSEISISETQGLGNAFAGSELADEDLVFQYSLGFAALQAGMVTYIGAFAPAFDPGDFNGDGTVDGADFLLSQRDDGTPAGIAEWQANYGNVSALAAVTTAVPEPSSLALIAVGLLGMGYRRRNRA